MNREENPCKYNCQMYEIRTTATNSPSVDNEENISNNYQAFATQLWYANTLKVSCIVFSLNLVICPMIQFFKENEESEFSHLTNDFNFMYYIGAIFGTLLCQISRSYKRSRKIMLCVSVSISLIGWILIGFSTTYSSLVLRQIITGTAMGMHSIVLYYCLDECIFVNKVITRNAALMCGNKDFYWGIMIFILVVLLPWWIIVSFAIIFNLFALINLLYIQESPYILLRNENEEEAKRNFQRLLKLKNRSTKRLFQEIKEDVKKVKRMEKVSTTLDTRTLGIMSISFVMYELASVLIYYYYVVYFIREDKGIFLLWLGLMGSGTIFLMKRFDFNERNLQPLIKGASIFTSISAIILGILFIGEQYLAFKLLKYLRIVSVLSYLLSYSIGWINVPHILFDRKNPYYTRLSSVIPIMYWKFTVALVFMLLFDQSSNGIGYFSLAFGVLSLFTIIFIPDFYFVGKSNKFYSSFRPYYDFKLNF